MKLLQKYWKSFVIAAIILYGCILRTPHYTLPPINNGDKYVHLLAYAILAGVLMFDHYKANLHTYKSWLLTLIIPTIYGGAIELIQKWWCYPRTGDWYDWAADCVGITIGATITQTAIYTYEHTNKK